MGVNGEQKKSVKRITFQHHKPCQVIQGDRCSYPHLTPIIELFLANLLVSKEKSFKCTILAPQRFLKKNTVAKELLLSIFKMCFAPVLRPD